MKTGGMTFSATFDIVPGITVGVYKAARSHLVYIYNPCEIIIMIFPIKYLLKELFVIFGLDYEELILPSKSTVYEENQGTIIVDKSPHLTPIYKHIAMKYHWLR